MEPYRKVQLGVSLSALLVALAHLLWPDLAIDNVTLVLLILAAVPWLVPLFKSLEFPGGWKLEFQELARAKEKADQAGLLSKVEEQAASTEYSFQIVADEDPNLALAGLRIEIEKKLMNLADAAGIKLRRRGVGALIRELTNNNLLTNEQNSVLADIVGILNSGAHGAVDNYLAAKWALDIGPRLLNALDHRISGVENN